MIVEVLVPHQDIMIESLGLAHVSNPETELGRNEKSWINGDLTQEERDNIQLIYDFWRVWRKVPFDADALKAYFAPNVIVRNGWRGDAVAEGRDNVLALYQEFSQRPASLGETSEFRFPILVAKGPIVFHTWVWIAKSEQENYHIERPMAAMFLIANGLIERWDDYATGKESAPAFTGGDGPDGL